MFVLLFIGSVNAKSSSVPQCPDSTTDLTTLSTFTRFARLSSSAQYPHTGPSKVLDVDDDEDEIIVDDDLEPDRRRNDVQPSKVELPNGKVGRLILSDDNLEAMSFVEEIVGQLGIRTQVEEVHPGVFYPLAQKLLLAVNYFSLHFLIFL